MPAALLDRAFLERLERLTIHWLRSFPGLVGGHNASVRRPARSSSTIAISIMATTSVP